MSNHVYRSVLNLLVCVKMNLLFCVVSRLHLFHMAGLWSHPDEILLLTEDEESDGVVNVLGPGRSLALGYVDGALNLLGPGRSSGLGTNDGESALLGLQRSSQFGRFGDYNVNSQAITPFQGDVMRGSGPISSVGNTRRMGHLDILDGQVRMRSMMAVQPCSDVKRTQDESTTKSVTMTFPIMAPSTSFMIFATWFEFGLQLLQFVLLIFAAHIQSLFRCGFQFSVREFLEQQHSKIIDGADHAHNFRTPHTQRSQDRRK